MEKPEATEPTEPGGRIDRRRFLIAAGAIATGGAVGGYLLHPQLRELIAFTYRGIRPEYDQSAPTGKLEEPQLRTILALSETLVPPRHFPNSDRARRIIDDATSTTPGLLAEYVGAARYLDAFARRSHDVDSFGALPLPDRDALLTDIFWAYPAGPPGNRRSFLLVRVEPLLIGPAAGRLRALVARDLMVRMYLETQAVLIGYAAGRGVPGDPRAYVTAPATLT